MVAGQPRGAGDNVPPVSVRVADGVATITMAAPALTADAKRSLVEALPAVGADDSVRAIVLTGTGRVFCAGQDLGEHAEALRADPGAAFQTIADHYNPIVSALAAAPKPVLAAINGTCAGAGLSLALACDVRICAAEAKFSTAFTGIGLAPDSGLSASLARAVGAARASELILLSEPFTASDALAWGLVGRLAPAADLPAEAAKLAGRLAAGPTLAYAAAKHALARSWGLPLGEVLQGEQRDQARLGLTQDHRDAVTAFLSKQQPVFRGR
ncbi:MAG TPA: enoyl-CoA hydratase-related protein [Streptosporangiaceae bacterium]